MSISREVAEQRTILKVLVGSHVHGLNVESSDRDVEAIIIEPMAAALGLSSMPFEELIIETPEEDIKYVSLRKWCRLALKGNPNFLLALWAPASHVIGGYALGSMLREKRDLFVSKAAGRSHLGYMQGQRHRMLGQIETAKAVGAVQEAIGRGGGRGKARAEHIYEDGYDVKFGMHLLRLGMQGVEFLTAGRITLPMPEDQRSFLMAVRAGRVPLQRVLDMATDLERQMKAAMDTGVLPDEPQSTAIEKWMLGVYESNWHADALSGEWRR